MVTEKTRSEIHALEYSICELMSALDSMCYRKIEGWELNRMGLDVTITDGPIDAERWVNIRPVGWPVPSEIFCRFYKSGDLGWTAFEGAVHALHIGFTLDFRASLDHQRRMVVTSQQ